MADRPSFFRTDTGRSGQPLLYTPVAAVADDERGRKSFSGGSRRTSPLPSTAASPKLLARSSGSAAATPTQPSFPRRKPMRSRSPATNARLALRKKYTYAGVFLVISLVSFVVQTELSSYIQTDLGWDKAYCMMYLTHGSWAVLWPVQLLILRIQKWDMPWPTFWRRHVWLLRTTGQMVERQDIELPRGPYARSPLPYLIKTTAFITTALTIAGLSWYVAVNKTTPSDLTAIYNCSAFFAYAFSVPLLKERLRLDKSIAVAIAIAGVLAIAYGDTGEVVQQPSTGSPGGSAPRDSISATGDSLIVSRQSSEPNAETRFLGNMIIGAGSVLYGLYEVLYKRFACPPEGTSPGRGMIFANAFASLIGAFTLLVLWIPLPILHMIGWETFELPTGYTAFLLLMSALMNAVFAGSFLVLISLTSPVLSSVAALLTIFLVAIVDWIFTGQPIGAASLMGGCLIIFAFLMLSWSTWREMAEDERKREVDLRESDEDEDDSDFDA